MALLLVAPVDLLVASVEPDRLGCLPISHPNLVGPSCSTTVNHLKSDDHHEEATNKANNNNNVYRRTLLQPLAPGVGRVGVQLQWGTDPLQPGLIANLSRAFDAARIDFLWTMVEQQRGNYTFDLYDQLLAQLKLHNVTAAWNLDYGNSLWQNNTGPPYSVAVTAPGAVAAFARFAVASVRHFRGQGIVWGIYNEPNGHGYADPEGYVQLVLAVVSHQRFPVDVSDVGDCTAVVTGRKCVIASVLLFTRTESPTRTWHLRISLVYQRHSPCSACATSQGSALRAAGGLSDEIFSGPHIDGGWPILMGAGGWLAQALSASRSPGGAGGGGNHSILDYLDAVAFHPYRGDGCDTKLPAVFCAPCDAAPGGCGPETALADYRTSPRTNSYHLPYGGSFPYILARMQYYPNVRSRAYQR